MGKTRSHKLIALILSVAMVLSVFAVFPLGAAADGESTNPTEQTTSPVPKADWDAFVQLVNDCNSAEVQTLAKNSGNSQAEAFAKALEAAQAIVDHQQSSATASDVEKASTDLKNAKANLADVKEAKDAWVVAVKYVGGTIKYKENGNIDTEATLKTIVTEASADNYTNKDLKWTVDSYEYFKENILESNAVIITEGTLKNADSSAEKAAAIESRYLPATDKYTGEADYSKCVLIPADALVAALKDASNADGDMVTSADGYVPTGEAYEAYEKAYEAAKAARDSLSVDLGVASDTEATYTYTNGDKAVAKAQELAAALKEAFENLDLLVDEWKAATTSAYKDLLAKLEAGNNKYTAYGWNVFESKVNTIKDTYAAGPKQYGDDKNLQGNIKAALDTLEAYDLSPLAALIEQAEGLKTNNKDLKDALEAAKKYDDEAYVVSENYDRKITSTDADKDGKQGVATELAAAIAKVTATTTDLEELVAVAEKITNDNGEYTAKSFAALKAAIAEAKTVLGYGDKALPSVIASATTELQAAIDGLISLEELKAALYNANLAQTAIDNEDITDYDVSGLTQAQKDALKDAIKAAQNTINAASDASNTVTVKEIANDTKALVDAYNAIPKAPLTAGSTKAKAEVAADFAKLNAADYTALDYAAIKAAAEAVAAADVNTIVEKTKEDFDKLVVGNTAKAKITDSLKKINDYVAAINAKIAAKGAAYNANSAQAKDIAAYVKAIEAYVTKATTVADDKKGGVEGSAFNIAVGNVVLPANLTKIDALIEVVLNESEYLAAKAQADALVESDYTAATWAVLQNQLATAANVYGEAANPQTNNIVAVQSVTRDALTENQKVTNTASILAAIKNLKAVAADKTELNALLEQAAALNADDYTAESWAKLEAAVAQGNAAALQSEVDAAVLALKEALPGLVKVDRSALEVLVEQAKALNADDYTAESYAKVTEALAQAEAAKTQEEVDAAVAALKAAIAGLEKAPVEPVEELPVLKLLNKCPASYKLSLSKEGTNYTHIRTTWDDIDGVKIEYAWYSTNSSIVKASTADIDGNGVACDIVTEGVKAGSAICICVVKATLPDGTTATAAHAMTIKVVK